MNKVWFAMCIGAVLTAGMAGLTFGINLNPNSTTKFVWDWSAAGGWVSGLGATAAAVVAILQSHKASSNERIRTLLIDRSAPDFWSFRVVSEGLIPVTLLGVDISIKDLRFALPSSAHPGMTVVFPKRLDRGDVQQIAELDQSGLENFAETIIVKVASIMTAQGLRPDGMDFRPDDTYFKKLRSYRDSKMVLIIRLGHQDLIHDLDMAWTKALLAGPILRMEERTLEGIERRRKEYAKSFIGIPGFPPPEN